MTDSRPHDKVKYFLMTLFKQMINLKEDIKVLQSIFPENKIGTIRDNCIYVF